MTLHVSDDGLRFLLAEDDTVAAIDIECILEDLGHEVAAIAVVPAMALRALRNDAADVDAVIFGASLLGLPSDDLSRWLRRAGIPGVVTSREPAAIVRAMGFHEPCLEKPYARHAVEAICAQLLQARRTYAA